VRKLLTVFKCLHGVGGGGESVDSVHRYLSCNTHLDTSVSRTFITSEEKRLFIMNRERFICLL
jgi:hypothetical protein